MKIIASLVILLSSFWASAQSFDTTKVNVRCDPYNGPIYPDLVLFDFNSEMLSVTIIDFFSGTTNGPFFAIRSMHKDTIVINMVDASTIFYLDICKKYYTFQFPIKNSQDSILVKLDGKLYVVKNIITGVENLQQNIGSQINFYDNFLSLTDLKNWPGNLNILNSSGKQMVHFDYLPESISLQSFPKGIYFVIVSVDQTVIRKKIYIE